MVIGLKLNVIYNVFSECLLFCNEFCKVNGKNLFHVSFRFLKEFHNGIIFFIGFADKFYITFQGGDDMQNGNLAGGGSKFVSPVFAPGAFYYPGFSQPVEYLFEKLVRDFAAQGNFFNLQEAGAIKFCKL